MRSSFFETFSVRRIGSQARLAGRIGECVRDPPELMSANTAQIDLSFCNGTSKINEQRIGGLACDTLRQNFQLER